MSDQLKRILLFILFIVVAAGIAFALYWFFFRAAPEEVPGVIIGEDGAVVGLPEAGLGEPTVITPEEEAGGLQVSQIARGGLTTSTALTTGGVDAVSISSDGSGMNYYDDADGRFYRVNEDGTVTLLSNQSFPQAENVAWADQGDKAVIEFPDGSNIVYNFETETQVTLPSHWEDFDFAPDGDEIIAKSIGIDPSNRWLVITSDDGTQTESIAALGNNADKVQVSWSPNDSVVAFSDTGSEQSGFGRKMIIPIGKNEENFKGLVVEGLEFDSIWNPRGDKILYSVSGSGNNYKPMLWVVDGSGNDIGDNRRSLGIETWIDKCTFTGNTTVICAVPQNLPANSGLQPELANDTYDYLYEIDIASGLSTLLAIPDQQQSISNITLSSDDSTLYYTDRFGVLYMIKLK
ncbi:MAG: hypothetical protein ABIG32_02765 [Candidatus Uhrbacteria bacterium]|nr:hypothetical protein [Patescibacteria group bacterium]MBU1907086.1 hypothetical protein [Patescibacteria group bacterium]